MDVVRRAVLFAMLQGLAAWSWAAGIAPGEIEYQIKATYLYKFATYVEWPSSSFPQTGTPITVGVIGADEIAAALTGLIGSYPTNSRALEVKILKPGEPIAGVHILFIGKREDGRLKHLLEGTQSQPVLAVTESAGALDIGSVINFVLVDDHIRFEVSVTQAERNNLKISSRLLAVAQKIDSRKP